MNKCIINKLFKWRGNKPFMTFSSRVHLAHAVCSWSVGRWCTFIQTPIICFSRAGSVTTITYGTCYPCISWELQSTLGLLLRPRWIFPSMMTNDSFYDVRRADDLLMQCSQQLFVFYRQIVENRDAPAGVYKATKPVNFHHVEHHVGFTQIQRKKFTVRATS